jgi:hypothetical protein
MINIFKLSVINKIFLNKNIALESSNLSNVMSTR